MREPCRRDAPVRMSLCGGCGWTSRRTLTPYGGVRNYPRTEKLANSGENPITRFSGFWLSRALRRFLGSVSMHRETKCFAPLKRTGFRLDPPETAPIAVAPETRRGCRSTAFRLSWIFPIAPVSPFAASRFSSYWSNAAWCVPPGSRVLSASTGALLRGCPFLGTHPRAPIRALRIAPAPGFGTTPTPGCRHPWDRCRDLASTPPGTY